MHAGKSVKHCSRLAWLHILNMVCMSRNVEIHPTRGFVALHEAIFAYSRWMRVIWTPKSVIASWREYQVGRWGDIIILQHLFLQVSGSSSNAGWVAANAVCPPILG